MIKRLHQRKAVKESASPYPLTYPSSPAHKRKGLRTKPIHLGCCLCQRAAAPAQDAAALRRRAQQGGISSLNHCSRSWTYHCVFFYLPPSFILPLSHVLAAFCSYYGNICWKYRYVEVTRFCIFSHCKCRKLKPMYFILILIISGQIK